jgi:hypothetical protein
MRRNVMEIRVAPETDFIELLARLICESDDDPPRRIGKDLPCSEPNVGKWIQDCDFPFLMYTLALPDSVFMREFPGIALSHKKREAFAKTLEKHCSDCARCNAKQAEDIAWKLRVDEAIADHREAIGEALAQTVVKP